MHFLKTHDEDIRRFFPHFAGRGGAANTAYLVQHGNETVGVVVVRDAGEGVAQVALDHAPRHPYYARLGFTRSGDSWAAELA